MWTSTRNERLAMIPCGSWRRRMIRGRCRLAEALERTARTAATVAAPATRPPAAARRLREPRRLHQLLALVHLRLLDRLRLEQCFLPHGRQSIGGPGRQTAH